MPAPTSNPPFRTPQPPTLQENPVLPGIPPNPLVFEEFQGINTSTTRSGVDDKQAYWLDGFMPIGPRFLRTLYDVGPAIHTETSTTIVFFGFGNIGATPYCIVVHGDGSVHAVNTNTLGVTVLAAAGTITNPSITTVGISQWGSQYIIIVAQQTNGYFLWDGTNFYKAGTLGPIVTITNSGSGYTSAPAVSVSGGSGSGATFTATVAGGVVTKIVVTNPGSGWLAGETVTVNFSGGGGSGAAASIIMMPFAISGTALEIYSGRVWIVNGAVLTWSAPGSVVDFSSASGGGNTTSSDSFLRVGFTRVMQTNGFLYLIADSSINYISGVQTSGTPPVTTFTNQNADPETGTPWPGTVQVFGRNIVFCNAFGAHISYGAAVTKISEPLDGVYNTVVNFAGLSPSSAKDILFGKKIWMFLLPIVDPVTGQQVNKIFMWNGKIWWASDQSVQLTYIQHQEINSVLTAYGTDGTSIYPLFTNPSIAFTKTAQSKLWTNPTYQVTKAATRLWSLVQYFGLNSIAVNFSIDSEHTPEKITPTISPPLMVWTTQSGAVMNWTTAGAQPMLWTIPGLAASDPEAIAQQGVVLGMTVTTNCDDMALISATIDDQVVAYRG